MNERTIQRNIDDIRTYLEQEVVDQGVVNEIICDRIRKGYRLDQLYKIKLTNDEILVSCKILLDSHAFTKTEMLDIVERLIGCCVPEDDRKMVKNLIFNVNFHYTPPRNGSIYLSNMCQIGQAICQHSCNGVFHHEVLP